MPLPFIIGAIAGAAAVTALSDKGSDEDDFDIESDEDEDEDESAGKIGAVIAANMCGIGAASSASSKMGIMVGGADITALSGKGSDEDEDEDESAGKIGVVIEPNMCGIGVVSSASSKKEKSKCVTKPTKASPKKRAATKGTPKKTPSKSKRA